MPRIERMIFWLGGVLLPRLSEVAAVPEGTETVSMPVSKALELRNLERKLTLSQISPAEFSRLSSLTSSPGDPPAEQTLSIQRRMRIMPGILPLLDELSERLPLSLLSDYPHSWLLPSLGNLGLARRFPKTTIEFTANYPAETYAELLATLTHLEIIQPGKSLLVDSTPERAHVTVRRGIDVAIFIDARRLRRDLALWDILPPIQN